LPLPGTPFRKAAPGALSPPVRRRLEQLATKGQLYGQWRQQEATAQEMASARQLLAAAPRSRRNPPPAAGGT
jgi:hypothetical protein